jgi:hypothetical protein
MRGAPLMAVRRLELTATVAAVDQLSTRLLTFFFGY